MGFPLFRSGKKIGVEYPGVNFLSRPTKFFNEGKLPHCSFTVMPSHQPALMPFTYALDDFCPTKSLSLFSSSHLYLQHQWSRRREEENKRKKKKERKKSGEYQWSTRKEEEKKRKKKEKRKKEKWRASVE